MSTKTFKLDSLAARLSLWIITLGTAIFIVVLATNYLLSRFLLEYYVENLARTTTSATVKEVETIFNSVAISADSLAELVSTSHASKDEINAHIKALLNSNPDIFGMTVALKPHTLLPASGEFSPYYYRKKNTIEFSDLADDNYNYLSKPWYKKLEDSNRAIWSEPYLDSGGGNVAMTTYSTPVHKPGTEQFAGVATADIQLDWLNDVVNDIHIGATGFGFIISSDDVVIAHPEQSLNMKKLNKDRIGDARWQEYLRSKTTSSSVYLYTQCLHRQGNCWVAIETLGNTGWKVVIVLPEDELTSEINSLTVKISLIAVAGLIALFIVISTITRRLTSPLAKLAVATREIGAGHLDAELPAAVRDDEIGTLTDDFSSMRSALKKYIIEVQESAAKQQKLESEIQIAKDIQMSMIPGGGNVSIKSEAFQLHAFLKPARSVGGDLYYYQHDDDVLHFIIGDVSDKGVPAALFMAKTVTLYTRALKDTLSPGQTFSMMNDILSDNNDACMFVTALCGRLDLTTGKMVMANAGHMNPVLRDAQSTSEHAVDGATALGLMDGVDYPDIEFDLKQGSALLMYTDGISEAHDTENNQYSDERLIEFISSHATDDIETTGKRIIDDVDSFAAGTEQFDDITLLIIHYG